MAKYRKKPVVIEAWQFDPQFERAPEWLGDLYDETTTGPYLMADGETIQIPTLEGVMTAKPGDWIIRGIKGEIYPCKDEIFRATYEEA